MSASGQRVASEGGRPAAPNLSNGDSIDGQRAADLRLGMKAELGLGPGLYRRWGREEWIKEVVKESVKEGRIIDVVNVCGQGLKTKSQPGSWKDGVAGPGYDV